jgi:hypothetical protein
VKSWKEIRPAIRRAVEMTGGRAEFKDRHAPTWDGKTWHFYRTRSELHVVHEVAHWLALPQARHLPNYGLGKDPDGGPRTGFDAIPILFPNLGRVLQDMTNEEGVDMLRRELSWEEEVATVLSIRLLYLLGVSGWKGEANRTHLLDERNHWKVFLIVEILKDRGVSFDDPIPGILA